MPERVGISVVFCHKLLCCFARYRWSLVPARARGPHGGYAAAGAIPLFGGPVRAGGPAGAVGRGIWEPSASEMARLSECLACSLGYPGEVDASPPLPGTPVYYKSSATVGFMGRYMHALLCFWRAYWIHFSVVLAALVPLALLLGVNLLWDWFRFFQMCAFVMAFVATMGSPHLARQITFIAVGTARAAPRLPPGAVARRPGVGLVRTEDTSIGTLTDSDLFLERPSLGEDGQPYRGPRRDPAGNIVVRAPCEAPDDETARELMLFAHGRSGDGTCPVRDLRSALVRAMDPCVPLPPDLRAFRTAVVGAGRASIPVVHMAGYYSEALVSFLLSAGYRSITQLDAATVAMNHRASSMNFGEDGAQVIDNSLTVWKSAATTYDLLAEVRGGCGNF